MYDEKDIRDSYLALTAVSKRPAQPTTWVKAEKKEHGTKNLPMLEAVRRG